MEKSCLRWAMPHIQYNAVAYSRDGKRIATAGAGGTAKIWDVGSGQWLLTLSGHSGSINGLAYSRPDSKRLATASVDGTARIWDAVTGQDLLTLHHSGPR